MVFITNKLITLALVSESPDFNQVLTQGPLSKSEPLVKVSIWRNIIVQALYQVIVLLLLTELNKEVFDGLNYESHDPFYPTADEIQKYPTAGWKLNEPTQKVKSYTMIYLTFAFMQLFNALNARLITSNDLNPLHNIGFLLPFILILLGGV